MNAATSSRLIWVRNNVLALALGLVGGAIFLQLDIPLPWTLGSLTMAAILALSGVRLPLSVFFRNLSRPSLGVVAGSTFTLPVALAMMTWWPVVPMLLIFYVLITALGWLYFTRVCKQDTTTAVFSATPGGLGEMTLMGADLGGNMRVLVLVHTIRVITAIVALPFIINFLLADSASAPDLVGLPSDAATPLAPSDWALLIGCAVLGFYLGRPFKRIGGIMLVPLFLSIAVHVTGMSHASPPPWVVIGMQVIIGSIAGSRFFGITAKELRTTVIQGFVWAVVMLGAAFMTAALATNFLDVSLAGLLLAFSPGGFAEMTILAYAMGIEVAFVVSCHVLRAISVLLLAPMLAMIIQRNE